MATKKARKTQFEEFCPAPFPRWRTAHTRIACVSFRHGVSPRPRLVVLRVSGGKSWSLPRWSGQPAWRCGASESPIAGNPSKTCDGGCESALPSKRSLGGKQRWERICPLNGECYCQTRRDSFTCPMMLDFILRRNGPNPGESFLSVGGRLIPLAMVRNHRARRYLLRLSPDGSARLTIPRRGFFMEGRRFAELNSEWLVRQFEKLAAHPVKPKQWQIGTEILFRGQLVKLEAGPMVKPAQSGVATRLSECPRHVEISAHGS
jgi:hypothetical protein